MVHFDTERSYPQLTHTPERNRAVARISSFTCHTGGSCRTRAKQNPSRNLGTTLPDARRCRIPLISSGHGPCGLFGSIFGHGDHLTIPATRLQHQTVFSQRAVSPVAGRSGMNTMTGNPEPSCGASITYLHGSRRQPVDRRFASVLRGVLPARGRQLGSACG